MRDSSLRVEPVDNQHPAWGAVLTAIFRTGNQQALQLGEDGWLSARQTVLAAFAEGEVVGHLCFSVKPVRGELGGAKLVSCVDSFSVDAAHSDSDVDEMLQEVAAYRAQLMRCAPPRIAVPA